MTYSSPFPDLLTTFPLLTYSTSYGVSLKFHDVSLFFLQVIFELSDLTCGFIEVSLYLTDMAVIHVLFVRVPLAFSFYLVLKMADLLNGLL